MRFARLTAGVASLALTLLVIAPASAQTSISKVAIANPAKIFNALQETNDLKAKLENERKTIEATDLEKRTKIRDLQAQRDALKPDSPQYAERNEELLKASIDYEVWKQLTNAHMQRNQKLQIKSLYDKITNSIAEVGTQRGVDLVIAEQRPEIPADLDQINIQQLQLLIAQRNIMFNTALVDLSDAVVAAMDAKYKAGK